MKQVYDLLVCVAGWEDRFAEGVKSDLEAFSINTILIWRFEEFRIQTDARTTEVLNHAWFLNIDTQERSLRRHPEEVWSCLKDFYSDSSYRGKRILLDITTMPREVIWWTLSCLREASCSVDYIYHHPQSYSNEWLTRDTARPRLVYQHSGIAKLGKPTALLLLSGFDTERARQMVRFFEPKLLQIGVQSGKQFDNESKNAQQAEILKKGMKNVCTFSFDAFSPDAGYSAIRENLIPIIDDYNVVAASLGPKTSAVALFRLISEYPEMALAYAPSRQFNSTYSLGIGGRLFAHVSFGADKIGQEKVV